MALAKSARKKQAAKPGHKHALVAEGGGFRNVFTAGVLDAFIVAGFDPFDVYIGVSGGAMALSSYVARQYKRSYKIITEIAAHPEFVSARRYMLGGDYLGLDLLSELEREVFPFDVASATRTIENKDFVIVCTDVDSGQPCYVRPTAETWDAYLQASGAVPLLVRKPVEVQGSNLLDGGLSSPLPVGRAVELGADRITVVRTRLGGFEDNGVEAIGSRIETALGSYLYGDYPRLQKIIKEHANIYNAGDKLIREAPVGVTVVQIVPDTPLHCSTTQQTRNGLQEDYRRGVEMGMDFMQSFKNRALPASVPT